MPPVDRIRQQGDSVIKTGSGRLFVQYCGAAPGNPPFYSGLSTQYMAIEGLSTPLLGGITPIRRPHPTDPSRVQFVGAQYDAADFATATVRFTESRAKLPIQVGPMDRPFTIYISHSSCPGQADNLDTGWSDYVMVLPDCLATGRDFGARTPVWDNDEALDDSVPITITREVYSFGSMACGLVASVETNAEVVAAVYGSTKGCGNCGISATGTDRIYTVTKASTSGSPGLPTELVYTTDNWRTRYQASIGSMGVSERAYAIDIVGNYLVILGDNAYYYASIQQETGIVGTFSKVSTGFVTGKAPQDMFAASANEVWFAGVGGYIYKSENLSAGVSVVHYGDVSTATLRRVKSFGATVVAVGDSGVIITSINGGRTWGATTSPTSWGLYALEVIDSYKMWVGSGTGKGEIYYTDNRGISWATYTVPSANGINDIVAATNEIIYVAFETSTPAGRIYATHNGGYSWYSSAETSQPRFLNWPTLDRINRIAIPYLPGGLSANYVTAVGLDAAGTDGVIVNCVGQYF